MIQPPNRLISPDPLLRAGFFRSLLAAAVLLQVEAHRREAAESRLRLAELQRHERADGVVDEHQQGAAIAAPLEPLVVTAVDLDELASTLPDAGAATAGLVITGSYRPLELRSSGLSMAAVAMGSHSAPIHGLLAAKRDDATSGWLRTT